MSNEILIETLIREHIFVFKKIDHYLSCRSKLRYKIIEFIDIIRKYDNNKIMYSEFKIKESIGVDRGYHF